VGEDHRRRYARVPEQLLHRPDVGTRPPAGGSRTRAGRRAGWPSPPPRTRTRTRRPSPTRRPWTTRTRPDRTSRGRDPALGTGLESPPLP